MSNIEEIADRLETEFGVEPSLDDDKENGTYFYLSLPAEEGPPKAFEWFIFRWETGGFLAGDLSEAHEYATLDEAIEGVKAGMIERLEDWRRRSTLALDGIAGYEMEPVT